MISPANLYKQVRKEVERSKLPIIAVLCLLMLTNCWSRQSNPEVLADGEKKYLPVAENKLSGNITLCRNLGKTSQKPLFAGTTFPVGEKERVLAWVCFENWQNYNQEPQLFHVEWINPNGVSIFKKEITQILSDTANTIQSSLSSESRTPGNYLFRVFHFRELIAEKPFRFIDGQEYNDSLARWFGASITMCRSVNKTTGELSEVDSVFYIGQKNWVNAVVSFRNKPTNEDEELKFLMEWIAPDSTGGYNRRISIPPGDTAYLLRSSVSISPGKRPTGAYRVNLYLFRQLIAQQTFTLMPQPVVKVEKEPKRLPVSILLCTKYDKETGEIMGQASSFVIQATQKVTAVVDLSLIKLNPKKKIAIHWENPEGSTFYRKNIDPADVENTKAVTSSVSATPDNRKPGQYRVKVFQGTNLLAEKEFRLVLE